MVAMEIPSNLVELLYLRHVWELDVLPEMPKVYPAPPLGTASRPDRKWLEQDWLELWATEIAHDPHAITAPESWRSTHGTYGFDHQIHREWKTQVRTQCYEEFFMPEYFAKNGKMVDRLENLEAQGVNEVIVLPLQETYLDRPGPQSLIVATATLRDDNLWKQAIAGASL
ncbi:hypothetical protein V5R04_08425 [Jonesiaceae bacterium BS-20]|uniref:Uncharacterized protein n=1 Tax=Jonesiaceae bacterium BS-20 TaxID=3120821 RepID=A0AAU7DSK8_9MICO